ncbi:DUF6090 family protein [Flavobacteriaceae bacterium S0862]|nr:DUF6090 family protein [Flavobacteriaceae bacterium S0862]
MIKFFRRIRYNLMEQNKTAKYFKYAIGEIILVVIGILIALSINNWNENQNRLKKESVLLTQLKDELIDSYYDIHNDYSVLNQGEISHYKILDYIEQDLPYNDSLCFDFEWLKEDEYIYPNTAVYKKITDDGLDIIRNDTIRMLTQNLYEDIFPRISKEGSFYQDISEYLDSYYINNFKPNKNYQLKTSTTIQKDSIGEYKIDERKRNFPLTFKINGEDKTYTLGFVPLDFETLKEDTKFQIMLRQVDDYRAYKIGRYSIAKETIKYLVNLIEKEIPHD